MRERVRTERKRDKLYEREREREEMRNTVIIKKYILVLQQCYSAILPLELHCSTITNFLQYLGFTSSDGVRILDLNAKICLHLAFNMPCANATCNSLGKWIF